MVAVSRSFELFHQIKILGVSHENKNFVPNIKTRHGQILSEQLINFLPRYVISSMHKLRADDSSSRQITANNGCLSDVTNELLRVHGAALQVKSTSQTCCCCHVPHVSTQSTYIFASAVVAFTNWKLKFSCTRRRRIDLSH